MGRKPFGDQLPGVFFVAGHDIADLRVRPLIVVEMVALVFLNQGTHILVVKDDFVDLMANIR